MYCNEDHNKLFKFKQCAILFMFTNLTKVLSFSNRFVRELYYLLITLKIKNSFNIVDKPQQRIFYAQLDHVTQQEVFCRTTVRIDEEKLICRSPV